MAVSGRLIGFDFCKDELSSVNSSGSILFNSHNQKTAILARATGRGLRTRAKKVNALVSKCSLYILHSVFAAIDDLGKSTISRPHEWCPRKAPFWCIGGKLSGGGNVHQFCNCNGVLSSEMSRAVLTA